MLLRKSGIMAVLAVLVLSHTEFTAPCQARGPNNGEIEFPSEEFAKLDTFEGLNLEDGDKLFAKKDYKGAFAEYKAYTTDFPKGKASAYATLRMARCLHLMKKRNAAIRFYQEVVDYFPNDVRYAAGALYYMGLAHRENGEEKKCIATWARMVKDKEYVTQKRSARALNYLAAQMDKQKAYEEAAEYRWRIATAFRKSNVEQARSAKDAVRYHYVIRSPNHQRFMEFYREAGGFHHKEDLKDLEDSEKYWRTVLDTVVGQPKWESKEARARRKKAAPYWIGKFGLRFPKNDGMRERAIAMQFLADGDKAARIARLRKQAASMPMSIGRLIHWLGVFAGHPDVQSDLLKKHETVVAGAKVKEVQSVISKVDVKFRSKLYADHIAKAFHGMKRGEQMGVLSFLMGVGLTDQAKAALFTINMKGITDPELVSLAHSAGRLHGETAAMGYFGRMKDKKQSLYEKYKWYCGKVGNRSFNASAAEKALALLPEVARYPEWAQETLWKKAELLHRLRRYPEAIKAYKATNRQPEATWKVVDCLLAMKNYPKAITTVKLLESSDRKNAVKACMKVADIYKMAGNKAKEIEQLRVVLHRYPKSSQSSAAHQRLENYGAKVTGGRAKAD